MATIHTFTGNEVIATEVPKYLNDNFSALNTETANLSKSVVKTINSKSPVNGNINITGFDSYWEANEQISVGDIRIPRGRENSGYIFECTKAGTTGSTQPEFLNEDDTIEIANFADLGKIGSVRVIFNMAEKEVDEVLALGVVYSRSTYPELWEWAGKRTGLIISEAEWQQKYTASNGKFVPYYSMGDGSSTFRTPLLGAYLKGAEASADVGKYVEAGLPNITGTGYDGIGAGDIATYRKTTSGAFSLCNARTAQVTAWAGGGTYNDGSLDFDASRSNPIYGNSDTVTPETMTGIWVIKAVGVVVDSGETDLANMLQGVEQIQSGLSDLQVKVDKRFETLSFMPDYSAGVTKTNNTTYTAECDGYLKWGASIANGGTSYITINGTEFARMTAGSPTGLQPVQGLLIPIPKGTTYRGTNTNMLIFYPMKAV